MELTLQNLIFVTLLLLSGAAMLYYEATTSTVPAKVEVKD